jgi:hypothetical protein
VSSIEIDVEGEGSIIGRGEEEEMSSLVHFELFSFNLIFFVVPLVRKEEVEGDDDEGDDDDDGESLEMLHHMITAAFARWGHPPAAAPAPVLRFP